MKLGIIVSSLLITIFVLSVSHASAMFGKNHSQPVTSPITGPLCKPGWGYGDKNHCHFGPPGQLKGGNISSKSGHK